MTEKDIRSIIQELLSEAEDFNIDPDIEGKPYGEEDIWPGSDIEGIKQHGTGMPHGSGYPNWRQRSGLTKKDLRDILFINSIEGIPEDDEFRHSKVDQQATYNFIKQHFPYIFNYGHMSERWPREMWYPFADYFSNQGGFLDWRRDFYHQVESQLGFFIHWRDFDKAKLKGAAKYNRHWISRYKDAQELNKKYPTLERDLKSILSFLNKLFDHSPSNPRNSSAYPFFVSLYDTTRRLGGSEEGGWWYNEDDLIHSIKVENYKQMRQAAVLLLKMTSEADLNGKPLITLEKESGGRGNKPPPSYDS